MISRALSVMCGFVVFTSCADAPAGACSEAAPHPSSCKADKLMKSSAGDRDRRASATSVARQSSPKRSL